MEEKKAKIFIACDHAAFDLKKIIKEHMTSLGYEVEDLGCDGEGHKVDYPEYAAAVCKRVVEVGDENVARGILICGTGIGMSMAANKVKGIRCGLCHDYYTSEMTRRHNNANVLAMGARVTGSEVAKQIAEVFMTSPFESEHVNHAKRVNMLKALDEQS